MTTQIDCNSALLGKRIIRNAISLFEYEVMILAPSGCLQYYWASSGIIQSFNYGSAANSALNSVGVDGTRQLANMNYG